ncbi:MAG TPA: T9SS type A sorting domain-containing protein [bacterium]|nr:T9SS type A sorting domain-containing protein [bacterium]
MKRFMLPVFFILLGMAGLRSETMDVCIYNPRTESGYFRFDILIRRLDDWDTGYRRIGGLGNSDFYFLCDTGTFAAGPALENIEPEIENNPGDYHIEAKINTNRLQVKLEYYKKTMVWQPGLNVWETVCTVVWELKGESKGVRWDEINSGFSDGDGDVIAVAAWLDSTDSSATPVWLPDVQAEPSADGIWLIWSAEADPAVAGYHVRRSFSENGVYERLNSTMIPAVQQPGLHRYAYLDEHAGAEKTWWYRVEEIDAGGGCRMSGSVCAEGANTAPTSFALSGAYPNPFNPVTRLEYQVPVLAEVSVKVYTLLGQELCTLVSGRKTPGVYTAQWDGKDALGRPVSSGVYLIRMQAGRFRSLRKVTLIR